MEGQLTATSTPLELRLECCDVLFVLADALVLVAQPGTPQEGRQVGRPQRPDERIQLFALRLAEGLEFRLLQSLNQPLVGPVGRLQSVLKYILDVEPDAVHIRVERLPGQQELVRLLLFLHPLLHSLLLGFLLAMA